MSLRQFHGLSMVPTKFCLAWNAAGWGYLTARTSRRMDRENPQVPFERYADDIICHCRTEGEARRL